MAKILFEKGHKGYMSFLGRHHSDESKVKMSLANKGKRPWLGRTHSEASKLKMSLSLRGRNPSKTAFTSESTTGYRHWNWKGGKDSLPKCGCGKKLSTRKSKTCVKCMHLSRFGHNHPNWVDGNYKKQDKRNDSAYQDWIKKCRTRDKGICRISDSKCKGRLEVHHILSWRKYPELRYQINNGITLCHAHHPRRHEDEAKLSPYFQKLVAEMQ